jgi:hypothetical protein
MKYFLALFFLFSFFTTRTGAQTIGGIGASLILDTTGGTTMPRIMSLVPGTPAYQYLNATDYIMTVNGISCKDKTIEEVVSLIRGDTGTHVKITVADTKEGKRPRNYDLVRTILPSAANQPPPDPVTVFNEWCDNEVVKLKANKFMIIKTFTATCGDRFFNFEAAPKQYHIRVLTLEDKGTGTAFSATARVFDNENESSAITLTRLDPKEQNTTVIAQSGGDITFKKECIGVVNVQMHDDVTKCHAIYVIVYK